MTQPVDGAIYSGPMRAWRLLVQVGIVWTAVCLTTFGVVTWRWTAEATQPIRETQAADQYAADLNGKPKRQFKAGEWLYVRRLFRNMVSCPAESGLSINDMRGNPIYPIDTTRFFLRAEDKPHETIRAFLLPPIPPGRYRVHTVIACQVNPLALVSYAPADEEFEVVP